MISQSCTSRLSAVAKGSVELLSYGDSWENLSEMYENITVEDSQTHQTVSTLLPLPSLVPSSSFMVALGVGFFLFRSDQTLDALGFLITRQVGESRSWFNFLTYSHPRELCSLQSMEATVLGCFICFPFLKWRGSCYWSYCFILIGEISSQLLLVFLTTSGTFCIVFLCNWKR